ncbi:MAG: hypothetical protein JWL77_3929 [Chthonomonadaceae bacterium]|nr:hypothetical protein [Chthonomonadaceae bacterium]
MKARSNRVDSLPKRKAEVAAHSLLPKFNSKPIVTEELWVSRANGQDLRELGYVPSVLDEFDSLTSYLTCTTWLPDDKHISFIYNGALYVVPTESPK